MKYLHLFKYVFSPSGSIFWESFAPSSGRIDTNISPVKTIGAKERHVNILKPNCQLLQQADSINKRSIRNKHNLILSIINHIPDVL
jgi:hypothetical protein